MKVFASDAHYAHNALELSRGKLGVSIECPQRVEIIVAALHAHGHKLEQPDSLDLNLVKKVHTEEYVDFLSTAWSRWQIQFGADVPAMAFSWPGRAAKVKRPDDIVGQLGYHSFAADCSIVAGTWGAVTDAAAMAQSAADYVIDHDEAAYALCRPPGHHATADQFGGYCFLNNSAIAAQRLLDRGMSQVAILDVDYHHGNGTQEIFYHRPDVLTISIHANPMVEFPWFCGHAEEVGVAQGLDANLNLPLKPGTDAVAWNLALDQALKKIKTSNIQALVIALGVDAYINDPLGTFTLKTDDYAAIADRVATLDIPTILVQEGGYAVEEIGENVVAFLQAFD